MIVLDPMDTSATPDSPIQPTPPKSNFLTIDKLNPHILFLTFIFINYYYFLFYFIILCFFFLTYFYSLTTLLLKQ